MSNQSEDDMYNELQKAKKIIQELLDYRTLNQKEKAVKRALKYLGRKI